MSPKLECFFDLTSPWTYLGVVGLRRIVEPLGLQVIWRPILVGGVFNAVNQELYTRRSAMAENPRMLEHYLKDLSDWARYRGVDIRGTPPGHPISAVKIMRAAYAAEEMGRLPAFMDAGFAAYWTDLRDVSDDAVLREIAGRAGLDPDAVTARIQQQDCKEKLRAATEEVVARGGYGSPTLFINETDMYFGQDRLPLVEAKLKALLGAG